MGQQIIFYSLALVVSICSVVVITHKNPVTAAIFLVFDLFFLAGIYATQGADFIAAIQVMIYAGAIMVLFIFVIMLLNLQAKDLEQTEKRSVIEKLTLALLFLSFIFISCKGINAFEGSKYLALSESIPSDVDNTYTLGLNLFTNYLWPFELASILILLAVVASIMIAKKAQKTKTV